MFFLVHNELICQINFTKVDEPKLFELINRFNTLFPATKSKNQEGSRDIFYHYSKDNIVTKIRISRSRLVASLSIGDCEEKDNIGKDHGKILSTMREILKLIAGFEYINIKFTLFTGLNCKEGSKILSGTDLFPLKVKPFGTDYDTGLMFRWSNAKKWPGTIVVSVLPMNSEASHIHSIFNYPNISYSQEIEETINQINYFYNSSIETVEDFVSDIFGSEE